MSLPSNAALIGSALAGLAYSLTPGPGLLALLGIGAAQGRRAGAWFICGHFAGDLVWSSLALAAIIGARQIGAVVFDALGLVCGIYIGWLGLRALLASRRSADAPLIVARRPLLRGIAFGLTNPKGYPVAVATFTALLSGEASSLDWWSLPPLIGAATVGFVVADVIMVALTGAAAVRWFYRRHEIWIVRLSGLLFLGFGAATLHSALPRLVRGR